ncbi:MAG: Gfo/Idh/MocA family oxidoreductase [Pyrinomonadaceae bacterium]|nr:Gfo/Idh/MocA family oxidoreductase [Pyrinomonadaceae bacterium]
MTSKVRIGIIGAGFARKVQMPAFAACADAEFVSVASGTLANARATAEEFGVPHFTDDWRETVGRDDVDLICITTPPNLHREMFLAALAAGKHVVAEKPMAMNVAEAEEMAAAAKNAGVFAVIDHELRFQPGRQKAYKMLRDGVIGKVRHAKYSFRAPHRGDPSVAWNWWSDINAGGGTLGAINSHVIDSMQWFLGTTVSSVSCQLQTHVKERRDVEGIVRPVTTDDEANMLLRFADGELTEDTTGLASVSMVEQPEYLNRLELFGTDGAMRIDHRGELYLAKNGESGWTAIDTDLGTNLPGIPDTGFARAFVQFAPLIIDAVKNGQTEIEHAATLEDGVAVQRVLDAARESNATGRRVEIGR